MTTRADTDDAGSVDIPVKTVRRTRKPSPTPRVKPTPAVVDPPAQPDVFFFDRTWTVDDTPDGYMLAQEWAARAAEGVSGGAA